MTAAQIGAMIHRANLHDATTANHSILDTILKIWRLLVFYFYEIKTYKFVLTERTTHFSSSFVTQNIKRSNLQRVNFEMKNYGCCINAWAAIISATMLMISIYFFFWGVWSAEHPHKFCSLLNIKYKIIRKYSMRLKVPSDNGCI